MGRERLKGVTAQFYHPFLETRVDWLRLDEDDDEEEAGVSMSRSDDGRRDYNELAIANVDDLSENKELYEWLKRYLKYMTELHWYHVSVRARAYYSFCVTYAVDSGVCAAVAVLVPVQRRE